MYGQMQSQKIMTAGNEYAELVQHLQERNATHVLVVCGKSIAKLKIGQQLPEIFRKAAARYTTFSDFTPNPDYMSAVKGVEVFQKNQCDVVLAIGGGSAMDVAKCIKLFATMDPGQNYLQQPIVPNSIPLIAVPTTAGTGSEATRFAVIYYGGEKQSVSHESCIPEAVLLDASVLDSLPMYHRKATMLDALCHGIESYWSVHSTEESQAYAAKAIGSILSNSESYLNNLPSGNENMLMAANFAGKAINLTQTTAGHAMAYKLTTLYGIAHGHAVALCVAKLWPYMLAHPEKCVDSRGPGHLEQVFSGLAKVMEADDAQQAASLFENFLSALELPTPYAAQEDYQLLTRSVNPTRLHNNPVMLTEMELHNLYRQIVPAQ